MSDLAGRVERSDLRGRRIVVIGAAGFIGSHTAVHLARCGADVVGLDVTPGWRRHLVDALDEGMLRFVSIPSRWPYAVPVEVLSGADTVVHLGYAEPSSDASEVGQEVEKNAVASLAVIEQLPPTVSSFVFASTALVYGRSRVGPLSESMAPQPDSPYAAAKVIVEQAMSEWATSGGTVHAVERSAVALRLATVYGPAETVPRALPNFIRAVLAAEPPRVAVADDARDYVHVSDVARGFAAAIERMPSGFSAVNIGTGVRTTTLDAAQLIVDACGSDLAPLVGSPSRPPVELVLDPSHACSQIGFRASIDLVSGVETEIAWFERQRAASC